MIKKLKISLFIIVIAILVIIIIQNQVYFMNKQSLSIDIYIAKYKTYLVSNLVMFILCFFLGMIISFLLTLSNRFRYNQNIKELRYREASLRELVRSLRSTIDKNKIVNKEEISKSVSTDKNKHTNVS